MINWINTSKSGRHGTEYIAVSIIKSRSLKRVNGKSTTQVILRFSSDAQKDLRLIAGDKLLIGFDETTKQICFKRTTDKGYKLTNSTSNKGIIKETHLTLVVQASVEREPVSSVQYKKENLVIESTHVSINAPEFFNKGLTPIEFF